MPRKADEHLEGRIVDAAYQLWSKGGEHALTMRAVAIEAGTTTPTLYERFRDKHDLIEFLRARARQNMLAAVQQGKSAVDVCRLGLEFMLTHGNEYLLLTADWAGRLGRKEPTPSYEFLKTKLSEELGGASGDYVRLALALVALVHGTAILILGEGVDAGTSLECKEACLEACQALIESAPKGVGGAVKR